MKPFERNDISGLFVPGPTSAATGGEFDQFDCSEEVRKGGRPISDKGLTRHWEMPFYCSSTSWSKAARLPPSACATTL